MTISAKWKDKDVTHHFARFKQIDKCDPRNKGERFVGMSKAFLWAVWKEGWEH